MPQSEKDYIPWGIRMNNEANLDELEAKTIYIIREAYYRYRDKLALLVSWGKDSITMLYIARKAFFNKIPIPVVHIDTTYKMKEIYEFRDKIVREWGLKLLIAKNEEALKRGVNPKTGSKEFCCTELKTNALKQLIDKEKFKAIFLAIRRDEHGIRAKERTFSPRKRDFSWDYINQPPELWDQFNEVSEEGTHIRVHPMLHWREIDIWRYIKRENIPVVPLYFSGFRKEGYRYRSIGCETCCVPIQSNAKTVDEIITELETTRIAERSGRAQDKEQAFTMQKIRALGYM
jgi:sulfate adenylyltransferase subunit 2